MTDLSHSDPREPPSEKAGSGGVVPVPVSDPDLSGAPENLTAASVSGGAWRGASVFGGAAMQFGVTILLARLLTPADFGTVALVFIVIGIANKLAFLGVGPALVQRKTLTPDYVQTAWTLSVIGGVVACAVVALCAPLFARVMGDESATSVFVAISPMLILVGVNTCSMNLLRREMKFRQLMVVDLLSFGLGYCLVAVPTALIGWGVWALVAAQLSQNLVACIVAFAYEPHPVGLRIRRGAAREIANFGGGVTASGLANYVALNGDYFVIGRTLGTSALGLYTRAYHLMNLPLMYVGQILSQVLMPAYSRAQGDRQRIVRGYLTSLYLVFTIAAPMMMFVLVAAPYLIRALYGSQWEDSILPLQVFAIFGAFRATSILGVAVAQALGVPWREFRRQILYAVLVVAGALIGSRWGIVGVALGTSLAIMAMYAAIAQLSHSLLGFTWRSFAEAHLTGVVCGLIVFAAGGGALLALRASGLPDLAMLVCLAGVCVVTAFLAVTLLPRTWRAEGAERAMSVALGRLPSRFSARLMRAFRIPAPASQK